jgi:hypothetical protein
MADPEVETLFPCEAHWFRLKNGAAVSIRPYIGEEVRSPGRDPDIRKVFEESIVAWRSPKGGEEIELSPATKRRLWEDRSPICLFVLGVAFATLRAIVAISKAPETIGLN